MWLQPCPVRHSQGRRAPKSKAEPKGSVATSFNVLNSLLDLRFAELDVLLRDRIVLLLDELVGHRARVLLGDVIEAGVRAWRRA